MTQHYNAPAQRGEYLERKRFFDKMLTIYGRKPVLEALEDHTLPCYRLHLAESNQTGGIIAQIIKLAKARGVEIRFHSRQALSRISRNGKQDQGVAADLACPNHLLLEDFLAKSPADNYSLIALDGITNPQNLGMIIRSVTASPCHGLLLPAQGIAAISPLVIKASAGTLFKSRLIQRRLRHSSNRASPAAPCPLTEKTHSPISVRKHRSFMCWVMKQKGFPKPLMTAVQPTFGFPCTMAWNH